MKKRAISLLLSVLMVFSVIGLTACSGEEEVLDFIQVLDEDARTITIYGVTEESTTEEAIAAVEERINLFTESIYNTHIILRLFTEDEYEQMLDETIVKVEAQKAEEDRRTAAKKAAQKAAKAAGVQIVETTTGEDEETDEKGKIVKKETGEDDTEETTAKEFTVRGTLYPKENGTQFDIFLVKGYDMFQKYSDHITGLDSYINTGKNKQLKAYIYPIFRDAAKIGGTTYGIPVNHPLGEYEYVLLDKALVDKYYYDIDNLTSLVAIEDYLKDIDKYEPDVQPLLGSVTPNVEYMTEDIPLIGATVGAGGYPGNLLYNNDYTTALRIAVKYGTDDEVSLENIEAKKGTFGAVVINGNYALRDKIDNEQFYTVVTKKPIATNDDVFQSMFCVTKYAKSPDRALEILTYIQTNTQIADIFQYGVEGTHFEYDKETDYVVPLNDEYSMGLYDTGNVYMITPSVDMDEEILELAKDNWAYAKLQNLDAQASAYLGLYYDINNYNNPISKNVNVSNWVPATDEEGNEIVNENGEVQYVEVFETITKEFQPLTETYPAASEYAKDVVGRLENFKEYVAEDGHTVTFDEYLWSVMWEVFENTYITQLTDYDNINSLASIYNRFVMGEAAAAEQEKQEEAEAEAEGEEGAEGEGAEGEAAEGEEAAE